MQPFCAAVTVSGSSLGSSDRPHTMMTYTAHIEKVHEYRGLENLELFSLGI